MSTAPPADIAQLTEQLGQFLSEKRVAHCESVARTATQLAQRWAPQLTAQAQLAGLLHDNAKALEPAELLTRAEALGVPISVVEREVPALLHGKVGAALLAERFGVRDTEVEQAIVDHVTGRKGMPLLSRLLYVADQAAADRKFEGVEQLRTLMFEDLDEAVLLVAKHKILKSTRGTELLELATIELYNSLLSERTHG